MFTLFALSATVTPIPDLSSIRFSNESRDFTLVGIYNALAVSSLDVGSCLSANCDNTLLSVWSHDLTDLNCYAYVAERDLLRTAENSCHLLS